MLRELMNEKRASQGKNAMPTGMAGKGQAPRQGEVPAWVYMEKLYEEDDYIVFRSGVSSKRFVLKSDVLKYKNKTG